MGSSILPREGGGEVVKNMELKRHLLCAQGSPHNSDKISVKFELVFIQIIVFL